MRYSIDAGTVHSTKVLSRPTITLVATTPTGIPFARVFPMAGGEFGGTIRPDTPADRIEAQQRLLDAVAR